MFKDIQTLPFEHPHTPQTNTPKNIPLKLEISFNTYLATASSLPNLPPQIPLGSQVFLLAPH
jgi:hypothetical protein